MFWNFLSKVHLNVFINVHAMFWNFLNNVLPEYFPLKFMMIENMYTIHCQTYHNERINKENVFLAH